MILPRNETHQACLPEPDSDWAWPYAGNPERERLFGNEVGVCGQCGKVVHRGVSNARWCSYRCSNDAYIRRRAGWRRRARAKVCLRCGKPFVATRRDALYCRRACRQGAYRKRKA